MGRPRRFTYRICVGPLRPPRVPPPNIDGMTYAWVHTINHPDGRPSLDGMAEGYLFDEVGRSRMTVVSFWPSAEAASSARAALAPAVGGSVVRDEVYEVLHDVAGGAPAGARPVAAALLDFDGRSRRPCSKPPSGASATASARCSPA